MSFFFDAKSFILNFVQNTVLFFTQSYHCLLHFDSSLVYCFQNNVKAFMLSYLTSQRAQKSKVSYLASASSAFWEPRRWEIHHEPHRTYFLCGSTASLPYEGPVTIGLYCSIVSFVAVHQKSSAFVRLSCHSSQSLSLETRMMTPYAALWWFHR